MVVRSPEFAPLCMKILVNRDSHSKSKLRIINFRSFFQVAASFSPCRFWLRSLKWDVLRAMWLDWDVGAGGCGWAVLVAQMGGIGSADLCFEEQRKRDGENET